MNMITQRLKWISSKADIRYNFHTQENPWHEYVHRFEPQFSFSLTTIRSLIDLSPSLVAHRMPSLQFVTMSVASFDVGIDSESDNVITQRPKRTNSSHWLGHHWTTETIIKKRYIFDLSWSWWLESQFVLLLTMVRFVTVQSPSLVAHRIRLLVPQRTPSHQFFSLA